MCIRDSLRSHHVDGILWDKLAQSLPACSAALEGIPVRKMACCEPPSPENSCIDYAGLAYQAAAYLIAQKHRNIPVSYTHLDVYKRQVQPQANIVPIDYDPSATKVNQENRIKLMLAVAQDQRQTEEKRAV